MDKFGEYKIKVGDPIVIFSTSGKKKMGVGKYIGKEKKGFPFFVPKFELKGRIFYGYECWWIPEEEAKRIENEHKH